MDQHSRLDRKSEPHHSTGAINFSTSHDQSHSHSSNGSSTQDDVRKALTTAFSGIKTDIQEVRESIGEVRNELKKRIDPTFNSQSDDTKRSKSSSHSDNKSKSTDHAFEVKDQDTKRSKSSSNSDNKSKSTDPTFNNQSDDSKRSKSSSNSDNRSKSNESNPSKPSDTVTATLPEDAIRIDPKKLDNVKTLDPSKVKTEQNLANRLGQNGDFLDPGGGTNTVIGGTGNDIVRGDGKGFNTIAGGGGENLFLFGDGTTNRIFDFNPQQDRIGLIGGLKVEDIGFGQGTNPTKAGIDSPLDSNSAVIFDRSKDGDNRILGSLTFAKAADLSEKNFVVVSDKELNKVTRSA